MDPWAIIENVPITKEKSYLSIFFYHMDGKNMPEVTLNVTFLIKRSSSENKLKREDFNEESRLISTAWNPKGDN